MIDPSRYEQARGPRGFTLVELLVALAVLGLIVALLSQVVTLTSQAISVNSKALDAAGQARLVFDRLATDLAARPGRSDLGVIFIKATGNDSLYFYSQVDGYSGARQVAAVGYRVQTSSARPYQLERGSVGTDWGPSAASNPVVQFLPNALAIPMSTDETNYEVLASGVFRLEFCELLNSGVMTNPAAPAPNTDLTHVTGLVVTLGILDANSLKVVNSSQLQTLAAALPDNTSGDDPLTDWNTAMASASFASGVPSQAIQGVRLFQRTFHVP